MKLGEGLRSFCTFQSLFYWHCRKVLMDCTVYTSILIKPILNKRWLNSFPSQLWIHPVSTGDKTLWPCVLWCPSHYVLLLVLHHLQFSYLVEKVRINVNFKNFNRFFEKNWRNILKFLKTVLNVVMLTPAMYFHPCSSGGLWPGVFQLSIFIKLACGAEPCLPIMGVMEIERPWRATRPTSQKHNENQPDLCTFRFTNSNLFFLVVK